WGSDDQALYDAFGQYGTVADAIVLKDRETGKSRGFGFVTMSSPDEAQAAIAAMDNQELDGRTVRVNIAADRNERPAFGGDRAPRGDFGGNRGGRGSFPPKDPSDTLFVGNLTFNATEDSVRNFFGEQGEILSCRLPTDRETGQPKGFAYVQFADIDTAQAALNALNGADFEGRNVRLDFSAPRTDSGFGGRGGRGGFGGNAGGYRSGGYGGNSGGYGNQQSGGYQASNNDG
ncbi:hypothetical protein HDU99_006622, partial [Rhizoclosmatium hyalinum]